MRRRLDAEVAARFLAVLHPPVRAWNTYQCYRSNLDTHLLPRFGAWKIRDWSRTALKEFLAAKLSEPVTRTFKEGGNPKKLRDRHAPETVARMWSTASAVASFAVEAEILSANPFFRLGKTLGLSTSKKVRQNRAKQRALSREQVRVFLAKVQEVAPRLHTVFFLLIRTGLRINEALALRVDDVNLEERLIRVEREKAKGKDGRWVLSAPKSDHGVRDVKTTPQLTKVLRRWLEVERAKDKLRNGWKESSPWLFYAEIDPATYDPAEETAGTLDDSNVRRQLRKVLKKLPKDFPRSFTPHGCRHTFASQLLAEGAEVHYVREQLGHESIKLTVDTYGSGLKSTHTSDRLDDPELESVTTQG